MQHRRAQSRSRAGRRALVAAGGNICRVPYDDDDDWVGEPPEGRVTRDRAKPEFWRTQRPPEIIAAGFVLLVIVLVVVLLLS